MHAKVNGVGPILPKPTSIVYRTTAQAFDGQCARHFNLKPDCRSDDAGGKWNGITALASATVKDLENKGTG